MKNNTKFDIIMIVLVVVNLLAFYVLYKAVDKLTVSTSNQLDSQWDKKSSFGPSAFGLRKFWAKTNLAIDWNTNVLRVIQTIPISNSETFRQLVLCTDSGEQRHIITSDRISSNDLVQIGRIVTQYAPYSEGKHQYFVRKVGGYTESKSQ